MVLLVAGAGFLLWRGLMDGQTNVLPATPNNPQTQVDEPPAQVVDVDPVAELENLGGTITRNDNGEVVTVRLRMVRRNGPQVTDLVTDAGLVHLKGMTKLQKLFLVSKKKITDARLVHLKEMANLQTLVLRETKATDASVAELQKTVPNCEITK